MTALTFGLFSDLHLDITQDGEARLAAFLSDCQKRKVDLVISAGDFTYPEDTRRCDCPPESLPVNLKNAMLCPAPAAKRLALERYAGFPLPHRHTLGNHEMDFSTKEEAVGLLGMPGRYYDFALKGWRFFVLDTNHYRDGEGKIRGYCRGDYFARPRGHWLDGEQLAWLEERLSTCPEPAILVSTTPCTPAFPAAGCKITTLCAGFSMPPGDGCGCASTATVTWMSTPGGTGCCTTASTASPTIGQARGGPAKGSMPKRNGGSPTSATPSPTRGRCMPS